MNPRELRHRVRIEQPGTARDSGGGIVTSWSILDVVPAKIETVAAGEATQADAPTSTATHQLTIRYRTGVTSAMRVLSRDNSFRILNAIDPDEKRKWLVLNCVEKVGDEAA